MIYKYFQFPEYAMGMNVHSTTKHINTGTFNEEIAQLLIALKYHNVNDCTGDNEY